MFPRFEQDQREIFVRGLASLALVDKKAHFVLSGYLEGLSPEEIMEKGLLPMRTFHRKFRIGRNFLLSFIEGETVPFRIDLKFPKV